MLTQYVLYELGAIITLFHVNILTEKACKKSEIIIFIITSVLVKAIELKLYLIIYERMHLFFRTIASVFLNLPKVPLVGDS